MTAPAISVVIPAYGAERFVAASIDSVLDQDRPPHEVIVVDDGSTDDTSEVIASFGDRVRGLAHETNRGEAATRNTGLAAATGDAIAMHDADDLMRPHRLRRQAEALVAAGEPARVGCVLGRQAMFSDDGGPLPRWALDTEGRPPPHGNSPVMAWRSTYETVGGYDEGFRVGTDSDWLVRVRAAGLEVVLIDDVVIDRRIHAENLTMQSEGSSRHEYLRSLRQVMAARRQEQP